MTMTIRHFTVDSWQAAIDAGEDLGGMSPGGVASRLGITRQAVHLAMNRGDLDSYRMDLPNGDLMILIPNASYKAFGKKENYQRNTA